ncbi:Tannase/feruloyl esterase [Xylariales sp. PMI_506]|nr:Tannase/feruloyl esterase [Xylariales sp. PMI_506]
MAGDSAMKHGHGLEELIVPSPRPRRRTRLATSSVVLVGFCLSLLSWFSYLGGFGHWRLWFGLTAPSTLTSLRCDSSIAIPSVPGGTVLSFHAREALRPSKPNHKPASDVAYPYCNVIVSYAHIGHNETINVQVVLPLTGWNGRFMGTGGGGWATGAFGESMYAPLDQGFSAAATDGGHRMRVPGIVDTDWAFTDGKPNLHSLQDFSSTALRDMTLIGQQVTASFYGQPAGYSYWKGCSTGGRQGLMMVQRFPELYDGVLAIAPAIRFNTLCTWLYWPQFKMNQLSEHPPQCEFRAIQEAIVHACDGLDGVVDGIISATEKCNIDLLTLVGKEAPCPELETTRTISDAAVQVAQAAYSGFHSSGNHSWFYGLDAGAPFWGLANTNCTADKTASGYTCARAPNKISEQWMSLFLVKDLEFDPVSLGLSDWLQLSYTAMSEYESLIGTTNADLSVFAQLGHKLITWHGLEDQLIPPASTRAYYETVQAIDPNVRDYYRHFDVPGVTHCQGGPGPLPGFVFSNGGSSMDALIAWVEDGVAPETLLASTPQIADDGKPLYTRPLCPWPQVAKFVGGDIRVPESFECAHEY